jgi:CHAT domain-containing protein/Tfp pilus assembly protein PilF
MRVCLYLLSFLTFSALTIAGLPVLSSELTQLAQTSAMGDRPPESGSTDRNEVHQILQQGFQQLYKSQLQAALESFQQAVVRSEQVNDRSQEAAALLGISEVYSWQGRPQDQFKAAQEALTLYQALQEKSGEAEALSLIGDSYIGRDNDTALKSLQQALAIRRELSDPQGEGFTLGLIGIAQVSKGEAETGAQTIQQAIALLQAPVSSEDTLQQQHRQGVLLAWMGLAEIKQGKLDVAADTLKQAMSISQSIGGQTIEMMAFLFTGILYESKKQPTEAIAAYQQAEEVAGQVGNLSLQGGGNRLIGLIYANQQQHDLALQFFQRSLSYFQAAGDRAAQGAILYFMGQSYFKQNQFTQAIEVYAQAIELFEAEERSEDAGEAWYSMAQAHQSLQQHTQAIEAYERSLQFFTTLNRPNNISNILMQIGKAYESTQDYDKAIESYQKALTVLEEWQETTENKNIRLEATLTAWQSLATTYQLDGHFSQALDAFQKALEMTRELINRNISVEQYRRIEVITLSGIARIQANQGLYDEALASFQQAIDLSRTSHNQDQELSNLQGLANLYKISGKYKQASESYQQLLTLANQENLPEHQVSALSGIATVYERQGEYAQAITFFQQTLQVTQEHQDLSGQASALTSMGNVYKVLGQYVQAVEAHQKSLEIVRSQKLATQPNSSEFQSRIFAEATILNNLGVIYEDLGQFDLALQTLQQAKLLYQSLLSTSHANVTPARILSTVNNIGSIYLAQEKYEQALQSFQESLALAQELRNLPNQIVPLNNIGRAYEELGRLSQAREYYQKSLKLAREFNDSSSEGIALTNIGSTYSAAKQYSKALEFYQQALEIAREIGQPTEEANVLSNISSVFLKTENFVAAEEHFLATIDITESIRDPRLQDTEQVSLFDRQVNDYEALQQALISQNRPDKMLKALEISERGRGRAFVELLASKLTDQQAQQITTTAPDIDGIKRIAQQQNATLVQYSVINNAAVKSALYIWVISPTGTVQFRSVDLAGVSIKDLTTNNLQFLGVRGSNNRASISVEFKDNLSSETQNLQKLYQLLIQPIQEYLPKNESDRIIFLPQGDLFLVPFPALQNEQGEYLIQNHTILTAPSIQALDLVNARQASRSRNLTSPQTKDLLIVGNPTPMPNVSPISLLSLPGAEAEANAIADFFSISALLGSAATETTIKQKMAQARIIHLATHGLLEYGIPQDSGVRDIPGAIALAPSATDDGLLTSAEILNMNLNADLVVLSACDTGRGQITGDGVIGLSRSFMSAGVPSVMVSLWAVDDDSTSMLMTEFYRQWQQNPDKAQALRQAMLKTMKEYSSPRDWAAFTLIGNAN